MSLFKRLSIQLKACGLPVLPYLIMLPYTWLFVCLSNCRACSQLWSLKLQSVVARLACWPRSSVYCVNRRNSLGQSDLELGSREFHIKSAVLHSALGCRLAGTYVLHSGGTPHYAQWGKCNENDGPGATGTKISAEAPSYWLVYNPCSNNKASKCKELWTLCTPY